MRLLLRSIAAVSGSALLVSGYGSEASAQSFFQQLFGLSAPPQSETPAPRATPLMTPGGRPYAIPNASMAPRRSLDEDEERDGRGGKYRTVCVRMCDGFYFPISNSTTRRGFFRDQMKCRASCGDDARLFHMPVGSTDIGGANDGNGRIYGLLAIAHKYKKTLTPGCQCRPQPWSEVEMARHARYAEAETETSNAGAERSTPIKTAESSKTVGDIATGGAAGASTSEAPGTEDQPALISAVKPAVRPTVSIRVASQPRNLVLQQPPRPAAQVKSTPAGSMGLGLGGSYAWPGDAPRR